MEGREESWAFATYMINSSFVLFFGLPLTSCSVHRTCMCNVHRHTGAWVARGIICMRTPSIIILWQRGLRYQLAKLINPVSTSYTCWLPRLPFTSRCTEALTNKHSDLISSASSSLCLTLKMQESMYVIYKPW